MVYQYVVTLSNGVSSPGLADMNSVAEWLVLNANSTFWYKTSKKPKLVSIRMKQKAQICCAHCDCDEYKPTTEEGSACECNHSLMDHATGTREALLKKRKSPAEKLLALQAKAIRKQSRREKEYEDMSA